MDDLRSTNPPVQSRCHFLTVLTLFVTAMASGCAPSVLLKPPAEWPAEWRGRRLYHTPRALIYATSAAAAGEADRLTNGIAEKHGLPSPDQPGTSKGLVIVVDHGDAPICNDTKAWLTLMVQGQAQLAGMNAPNDQAVSQLTDKIATETEELKPILDEFLCMIPIAVADADVSGSLALPNDASPTAVWAGILPTTALIRERSAAVTDLILETAIQREEIPPAAVWLVKPMIPTIRGSLAKEMTKQRDALFENVVRQDDPNWIAERNARKDVARAWQIVRRPGRSPADYDAEYSKVRSAVDRLPNDIRVLRVLAAAEYRTGKYSETIATLDKVQAVGAKRSGESAGSALLNISEQLSPIVATGADSTIASSSPGKTSDLAFRTMAEHRLGRIDEADKHYEQLQKTVGTDGKSSNAGRAYLIEVAALLGKPIEPTSRPASP
ncbi:MAG: hypothetical protein H6818_19810 [Phycisphaerales bacterium]|nr:hypothetical protein [Phycisphaerales bacterium]